MATASILALKPQEHTGAFSTPPLDTAVADKATELLQHNHERFHMYFNDRGFHNHLAHQMLALYAFNAPPDVLTRNYNDNASYQVAMKPVDRAALQDLEGPAKFQRFLYRRDHYHDYLALFEAEIQKLGVKGTLSKYLFAGDERAKDMMNRLYAGILHPVIHLGYGLEWNQPAITAEALAMTATHDAWTAKLYDAVEPLLAQHRNSTRTLESLRQEAAANATIRTSPRYDDDLRVRDGVVGRAGAEVVPLVAQWAVDESNLAAKIAELANFTCAMVAAAQRPERPKRVDFTLMHCSNAVPLVAAAAEHPDVPGPAKVQLVQRLGQYALVTFVAQGSPAMRLDLLRSYTAKKPEMQWAPIIQRAFQVHDDGHIIKLLRALRFAEMRSNRAGADTEGFVLKGEDWVKAGNMVVEVAERGDGVFVRGAGFDEGWDD